MKRPPGQRHCFECQVSNRDAVFPGARKPFFLRDHCSECAADLLARSVERIAARRASVAAWQLAAGYRPHKPEWGLPAAESVA